MKIPNSENEKLFIQVMKSIYKLKLSNSSLINCMNNIHSVEQ